MKHHATATRSELCWPACALVLLLLSACGKAQTPLPKATPSATTAPLPTATPNRAPVDLTTAWGQVTIRHLPTALGSNEVFVFDNAATPDGRWLVGALEPRAFLSNTTQFSSLILYNVTTLQVLKIHRLLTPQSQVIGAAADDHWIVWSEAPDQPGFFDWALFAYNRQTAQVQQLARAIHLDGQAVPGPTPMPTVDHGLALWGQAIGPAGPSTTENLVVRLADLASGQVSTLATKAGSPQLSWPWAAWDQITTGSGGYVQFQNLSTGEQAQLQSQPNYFALAGTSVTYSDSDSKRLSLIDDITQGTANPHLLKSVGEADYLQFVALSDRLIGWTAYEPTPQVWDRAEHRLVNLPTWMPQMEPFTWVAGHLLVWEEPEPPAQADQDSRKNLTPTPTLDVIETTDLPILP